MTKRWTVEIFRGEEEGGLKTVDFVGLAIARAYAEEQHEAGYAVIIHDNQTGEKIYDKQ